MIELHPDPAANSAAEQNQVSRIGAPPDATVLEVLTRLAVSKRLIAKVTGVGLLAGVMFCIFLPIRYTATTKIMPPQQTPPATMVLMNQLVNTGAGSLAAAAGMGLGLKNPNDIYVGLLTSRPVADAIIGKFDLGKVYRAGNMTDARNRLADNTNVSSEKNGFIAVSVTDKDKRRVAAMANAYTDQLRILTKTLAVTEASQRLLFYEDQLKHAKEDLLAAEFAFQQVQQQKGLVQPDAQAKAMIAGLSNLRAEIAAKQVELQALLSYSTEHSPDVQLAEREIFSLRGEAARLEQNSHSTGFTELGLEDVPRAGLEYLRAEHEVKYRQTLFDLLIKQYDAARLDQAKDAAIIQVVEPAIEPDRKSSPKRGIILLLSALCGLLAGALLALIGWWKDRAEIDPRWCMQRDELLSALMGRRMTNV